MAKSGLTKNIKIALTVIVALGLLYWGIEYLKGVNIFKSKNYYIALFDHVEGLQTSAPVLVKGYKVGQVNDITYDYENNKVLVEMGMDKDLRIPIGSSVSLNSSLLGTPDLVLTLSDSHSYYDVGAKIPAENLSGLMDKVGENVLPKVNDMIPKFDSILTNLNKVLANPALNTSVTRLDDITRAVDNSARNLNALMSSLSTSVPTVVNNVKGITTTLNSISSNLNELSQSLNTLPIDSTMQKIDGIVGDLKQLSSSLSDRTSSLGLLLNDKTLYKNATGAIASLDSLIQDIKKHPKRYINVKVF